MDDMLAIANSKIETKQKLQKKFEVSKETLHLKAHVLFLMMQTLTYGNEGELYFVVH